MEKPEQPNFWRRCSSCKKPIAFQVKYYTCSVSTCNGQRTGYVFCSVSCFEVHLPGARHKDAAAMESKAPTLVRSGGSSPASTSSMSNSPAKSAMSREVLVIASRLKEFIQARAD